jgi:hypothetical protein
MVAEWSETALIPHERSVVAARTLRSGRMFEAVAQLRCVRAECGLHTDATRSGVRTAD